MIVSALRVVDGVLRPHWMSGTTMQRLRTSIGYNKRIVRREYCSVFVSPYSPADAFKSDAPCHVCYINKKFFSVAGNIASAAVSGNQGDSVTTEIPFLLADIGEGIKEVELLQWFVNVGDHVHQFDKVCEVQSDKATVEITSRFDGTISKLHGQPGDMMQVGQPLMFLKTSSKTTATKPAADSPSIQAIENQNFTPSSNHYLHDATTIDESKERLQIPTVATRFHLESDEKTEATYANAMVLTSPAVRKLAREYSLDLTTIVGTGPQGRVSKSDVVSYLQQLGRWKQPEAADEDLHDGTDTIQRTERMAAKTTGVVGSISSIEDDEIVQLKGYNRMMLKSMTAALQTPHMCFGDEILVDKLLELRRDLNHHHHHHHAKSSQSTGKISTLAIFIKAFDVALSDFPMVNSIVHNVEQCEYKIRKSHNIGIAMDTPRGLVVPVIRNCQTLSIVEIQNELDRYKELAESGKFAESDLTDVTFTISNIGSIGGTYMQPVLAPPALAMAALGRIKVVPRFVNNDDDAYDSQEVYPASVLSATLAADHRFLDGATLARFARAFQRYVESPVFMLSRLK